MKEEQWFLDRVEKEVEVETNQGWERMYIANEQLVAWLLAAQEMGYSFRDRVIATPNVCVACEG